MMIIESDIPPARPLGDIGDIGPLGDEGDEGGEVRSPCEIPFGEVGGECTEAALVLREGDEVVGGFRVLFAAQALQDRVHP